MLVRKNLGWRQKAWDDVAKNNRSICLYKLIMAFYIGRYDIIIIRPHILARDDGVVPCVQWFTQTLTGTALRASGINGLWGFKDLFQESWLRKTPVPDSEPGRHGPKPGCQEAEAFSILEAEAEAFTLFKLEAEAEALLKKPKPGYLYRVHVLYSSVL